MNKTSGYTRIPLDKSYARLQAFVNMTAIAMPSFQDTKRLIPQILKRSGAALITLHFAREMSLELMNYLGAQIQAQGREDMPMLIGLVGLNFFCEIMWSAIWSFVLISATRAALRDEPLFTKNSAKDFNQLLIEGVRSMAAVLYRLPFAVIPGLIELLRLLFVPHVVLLEPLYQRGQLDALKRSRETIKQKWGLILVMTLASLAITNFLEAMLQGSGDQTYFWQVPGTFLFSTLLTLVINLVYEVYLVAVFLRLIMRSPGETQSAHLQLETN